MASISSVTTPQLYTSPIPLASSNLRTVENRIVINAPHTTVFNFVTTWSNLAKWLPMTSSTKVLKGEENTPSGLGDILYEGIKSNVRDSNGNPVVDKTYTVVAKVAGLYWVAVGTDPDDPWIRWSAHFTTFPLEGNKTLFCRVFQQACRDPAEPVADVVDAKAIQPGMELVKDAVEREWAAAAAAAAAA